MRSRERERRRWWWWSGWKDKTAISGWREREGGRRKMRRTEIEMAGGKQRQVVCEEVRVLMRVQG